MKVLHISTECYPAAKVGGLGDVVGALPGYLSKDGWSAGVILPKYQRKWFLDNDFTPVYQGIISLHNQYLPFTVEKEINGVLGFPLFVVDIPDMFDRSGIYTDEEGQGFADNVERFLSYQLAVLQWIVNSPGKPQILHCHDNHTGLIPFFIRFCPEYASLQKIPTVFTIHNGAYQGAFGWDRLHLLPWAERGAKEFLDWNNSINPLAAAIRLAWRVTTVSENYLEELKNGANGLEWLIQHEQHKAVGILNGIDSQVWDPSLDTLLEDTLNGSVRRFKKANKESLGKRFDVDIALPLIGFIGRLVREKGADLLPDLIRRVLEESAPVAIVVLGTGEAHLMDLLWKMKRLYPGRFDVALEYNEKLAHEIYAGVDFLLMPSRIEPCGLNQMYAMRYGTIPIVRAVGGLKDTVIDVDQDPAGGTGFRFDHFNLEDSQDAIDRGLDWYHQHPVRFRKLRERIMSCDFSWEHSTKKYVEIYEQLATGPRKELMKTS